MALTAQQIIQQRRKAILRAWAREPLLQVQVEDPQSLGRLAYISEGEEGDVGRLGRFQMRNAAIVTPMAGGGPDEASVWVRSRSYQGYDNAYRRFLETMYGIDRKNLDLSEYQVDHVLNRARSPEETTFVRVEAVEAEVNQRWGCLFEKIASDPEFYANQARERRTMSWTIAANLAGEMPPTGPDDEAGVRRIAQRLATHGLSYADAVRGLSQMFSFTYRLKA